jgi:hypothetical protein
MSEAQRNFIASICTAAAGAAIVIFFVLASFPDRTFQHWVTAIQALISTVGIGIAIAVPYFQRTQALLSAEADRRLFAAAFGVRLRPKLEQLRYILSNEIGVIDRSIAEQADADEVRINLGDEVTTQAEFLRDNWESIAKFDRETGITLVRAVYNLDKARNLIPFDKIWDIDSDSEGVNWADVWFEREAALMYRGHTARSLELLDHALSHLSVSQFGTHDTIVDLQTGQISKYNATPLNRE